MFNLSWGVRPVWLVVSCLASNDTATSQTLPYEPQDGVTFIELPSTRYPNDLHVLDVPLGNVPARARLWWTSNGMILAPSSVSSGVLQPLDLTLPIPFLSNLTDATYLGNEWDAVGAWTPQPAVPNWVLPLNPTVEGKGSSQQGMVSLNGTLYVTTRQKSSTNASGPAWNGLSRVTGGATPSRAFGGVPDQLKTTTTQGSRARPEGTVIAETAGGNTFIFSANYNGEDAAGWLHVQFATDPMSLNPAEAFAFNVYELLGDWTSTALTAGVYGTEVPRQWFTQSSGSSPGDKLRGTHVFTVNGDTTAFPNAGRQFLALGLNLDPVFPPLAVPLIQDCDPQFDPDTDYYPMDGSSPVAAGFGGAAGTRDEGKYDYVALIDITKLDEADVEPVGGGGEPHWAYNSINNWKQRTKFIRLPPDYPYPQSMPDFPCMFCPWFAKAPPVAVCTESCLTEGQDWSLVFNPEPCSETPPPDGILIVGSGSITGITTHPDGSFLYVITGDEDVEHHLAYNAAGLTDRDGGWHMPHLYSIDMSQVDLTDQSNLNYNSDPFGVAFPTWLERRRLNAKFAFTKVCIVEGDVFLTLEEVLAQGPGTSASDWIEGLPGYSDRGSGYVDSSSSAPIPYQIPDLGFGTAPQFSDEHFYIPTPRSRPIAVRNELLDEAPNRLYLGVNGWLSKTLDTQYEGCLTKVWAFNVGAVMSFELPTTYNRYLVTNPPPVSGLPTYRETILLPMRDVDSQYDRRTMQVGGMDILPRTVRVLGVPGPDGVIIDGSLKRNVLGVLAEDRETVGPVSVSDWENRLVLVQDT